MVGVSISGDGVGPLVRFHGKGNAAVYKQLVRDHVLPVLRHSSNLPSIFMQNNAPYHKAKLVMNFLKAENVTVMDWLAQTPGESSKPRNPKNNGRIMGCSTSR